jgi:nitrogen fixation protein NifU and related proteins
MDLDMYAEELIYHYEHPQNKGIMRAPSCELHEENISCGDKITVFIRVEGDIVKEILFDGSGCVISMGTASMLTSYLKGKKVSEVESFGKKELLELINIDPGPVRIHCATLSLRAVKKALFAYAGKKVDSETKEL